MKRDILRRCVFRPYRKGMGPQFTLTTWYCGQDTRHGAKDRIGYELRVREGDQSALLFTGEDFCCSPMVASDSDGAIADLMSFLTLRPGDTDKEYFAGYTAAQIDYCSRWAEALDAEVISRFGER